MEEECVRDDSGACTVTTQNAPPQSINPAGTIPDDISGVTSTTTLSRTEPPTAEAPEQHANTNNAIEKAVNEEVDVGAPPTPEGRNMATFDNEAFEEGYDSDGMRGPFYDGVMDENQLVSDEEEIAPEAMEETQVEVVAADQGEAQVAAENEEAPVAVPVNEPVANALSIEDIQGMKVSELRDQLKARNLKRSGNKEELRSRLKAAVEANVPLVMAPELIGNVADPEAGFTPGARWELLEEGDEVEEEGLLTIEGEVFIEPTVARDGPWEVEGIPKVKKKIILTNLIVLLSFLLHCSPKWTVADTLYSNKALPVIERNMRMRCVRMIRPFPTLNGYIRRELL